VIAPLTAFYDAALFTHGPRNPMAPMATSVVLVVVLLGVVVISFSKY